MAPIWRTGGLLAHAHALLHLPFSPAAVVLPEYSLLLTLSSCRAAASAPYSAGGCYITSMLLDRLHLRYGSSRASRYLGGYARTLDISIVFVNCAPYRRSCLEMGQLATILFNLRNHARSYTNGSSQSHWLPCVVVVDVPATDVHVPKNLRRMIESLFLHLEHEQHDCCSPHEVRIGQSPTKNNNRGVPQDRLK